MEQFRAGDELALRESFNHYGGMMQRVGMLCAGNDQEADDLLRRVFVRARRGRDGFTPDSGSLGSWLLGITHRLIADEYPDPDRDRRRGRRCFQHRSTGHRCHTRLCGSGIG